MPARDRRCTGFTLIELLVVISIISILIMILLPAVQTVREKGRMIMCANNMRQVGVALLAYHQSNRSFPPAKLSWRGRRRGPRHSLVPFILPHLEQKKLYETYLWDRSWNHPSNQTAINTRLSILRCPSAPGRAERKDWIRTGLTAESTDYAPVTGVAWVAVTTGLIPKPRDRKGVLSTNRGTRIAQILDGTSYTLIMGECSGRPEHWTRAGGGPDNLNPGGGNFPVVNGRVKGAGWADPTCPIPLHSFTLDGLSVPGACPINCTNNNEEFSFHTSGINVLFADGAIRYINENVGLDLYAAMVTRAGMEANDKASF